MATSSKESSACVQLWFSVSVLREQTYLQKKHQDKRVGLQMSAVAGKSFHIAVELV